MTFWILIVQIALGQMAQASKKNLPELPEFLQTKIIEAYSEGDCQEVRSLSKETLVEQLRPNVMAIVAYCEPERKKADLIFELAERKEPTGDLILVLHAMSLWKRFPERSKAIWRKVLVYGRNIYFRDLAKDYLAEVVDNREGDIFLNLSPTTGFARFFFGADYKSDVRSPELANWASRSSAGSTTLATLGVRDWQSFGSLALNYQLKYQTYFSANDLNLLDNRVDFPVAIHVAKSKDLVFRPLFGNLRLGSVPYQWIYGLGVKGVVYHANSVQSVQGLVFENRAEVADVLPSASAHYRFEYQWDFFTPLFFFSSVFSVEHVSAGRTSQLFGHSGSFELSHTDVGVDLKFERNLPGFTLGLAGFAGSRIDTNDSTYLRKAGDGVLVKQREDWLIQTRAELTVPLATSLQGVGWVEWQHAFSNLGPQDYIDYNLESSTVGVGIRASLASY